LDDGICSSYMWIFLALPSYAIYLLGTVSFVDAHPVVWCYFCRSTLEDPHDTMSAREVHIDVNNKTGHTLQLEDKTKLDGGRWRTSPTNVANDQIKTFVAESNGFMTGTEGTIYYSINGEAEISLYFDNPFAGSNKYDGHSNKSQYEIITQGGSGNQSHVTYTIQTTSSRYGHKS